MPIKEFFAKLVNWESVRGKDNTTAQRYAEQQKVERELSLERAKENQRRAGEELIRQRREAEVGEEEVDITGELKNL